jgi:NAD(P)-dependent dehydrogenase (short-subunit alcohol dehydrogenase family)
MLRITAEEVATRGRRMHCVLADVSSEKQVNTMISDVVRALGGLDVVCPASLPRYDHAKHDPLIQPRLCSQMVANAGISIMKSFCRKSVLQNLSQLELLLANLSPPISYCGGPRPHCWCQPSRHVPLLQVRRYANDCTRPWRTHNQFVVRFLTSLRITHTRSGAFFCTGACSGTGKQGQASLSAYSASKFGIRALTQCAGVSDPRWLGCCSHAETFSASNSALEFGAHGITVNAYAPGPVQAQSLFKAY